MPGWLQAILIAVAVVVVSWLLLIVLARRLPPGVAKDLAAFLPDCVTTMRTLRRDPRVPRRAKIALLIAVLWVLSPIDLIPEFLPVIGPLDDVIAGTHSVAEGVDTAPALLELAHKVGVDMPISATVAALLRGDISTGEVVSVLMRRSPKDELDGLSGD